MCPALRAVGQVADFSFRVLGAAALAMNRKLSLPVSSMTAAKQASASADDVGVGSERRAREFANRDLSEADNPANHNVLRLS